MKKIIALLVILGTISHFNKLSAQPFTHQDTLRGSITTERAWWDLAYYDLSIEFDNNQKFIRGTNTILFHVLEAKRVMQIDLQEPLRITKIDYHNYTVTYKREGNVYWITFPFDLAPGTSDQITIHYEGNPVEAKRPPWDGGLTWSKDENGNAFIATSCQGLGSSVWWPCKDHMYDEPDSMAINITAPVGLSDVSNGRLRSIDYLADGRRTYHWFVSNPINNYGVNANLAKYVSWADTMHGEAGILSLDFLCYPNTLKKRKRNSKMCTVPSVHLNIGSAHTRFIRMATS